MPDYRDRTDAGRRLAAHLQHLAAEQPVVLGLPRGGVVVAAEVARALSAPLDVLVVRKLGVPGRPEYAMGALGEGGVEVLDEEVVRRSRVGPDAVEAVRRRETAELARRLSVVRAVAAAVPLAGRSVVVVDDGLATGSTALAACRVARARDALRVTLAVPVGSEEAVRRLAAEADEVVCPLLPRPFWAVGQAYAEFGDTDEEEVLGLLRGP